MASVGSIIAYMSKRRHVSSTYYGIYQNKSFNDNDILTWHITDLVCREDRPNQGNTRLRMSLSRDYTLWFVLSNVVLCNVVNSYSRSNRQDILKMNIYYVSVYVCTSQLLLIVPVSIVKYWNIIMYMENHVSYIYWLPSLQSCPLHPGWHPSSHWPVSLEHEDFVVHIRVLQFSLQLLPYSTSWVQAVNKCH